MQFIIKYFPEMTIKSKPVRRQFAKQLAGNVKAVLKPVIANVRCEREWDKITVTVPGHSDELNRQVVECLRHISGIAYFLEVETYPLGDFDDVFARTRAVWGDRLAGKTFAVRVKRAGTHDFRSTDLEQYVGGGLLQHCETGGVDLKNPDITVALEVRNKTLFVVKNRHRGLGGFPLGSLDSVVSLISGGFDSTVSSFSVMKRGMQTHFCFFNLGGHAHEVAVKEVALYLWMKYGANIRVKFVSVPFDGVVAELLQNIDDSQMGVILKRMMLRAGVAVAEKLEAKALVTGEAVAQVSSQTLQNLGVIDRAIDSLVLRPLISWDKGDIIDTAVQIGTEEFAKHIPEYCGVISVRPTTRAKLDRVVHEESKFDFGVLDAAIENARYINIDEVDLDEEHGPEIEELSAPVTGSVIIDVRHPSEEELKPLHISGIDVRKIPFYELHSRFAELDSQTDYLLYCEKGVMSRLHASHLLDQGFKNVKVYRP